MIEKRYILHNNATICILKNDMSSEQLLELFSDKKKYEQSLKKIVSENRRCEFLGIRYALKLCFNGEEYDVLYEKGGKPILGCCEKNISFSHSKDYVVAMTCDKHRIGIDIELPNRKLVNIAKRFLSISEFERYKEMKESMAFEYLRILWSAKEAVFKIVGDSYDFSKLLHSNKFEIAKKGVLTIMHTVSGKNYYVCYEVLDSYTLAYCVDDE